MTDELREKILAYNRRIKADRIERDELKASLNAELVKEKDLQDKVSDMKEALDLLGVVPKDN